MKKVMMFGITTILLLICVSLVFAEITSNSKEHAKSDFESIKSFAVSTSESYDYKIVITQQKKCYPEYENTGINCNICFDYTLPTGKMNECIWLKEEDKGIDVIKEYTQRTYKELIIYLNKVSYNSTIK